MGCCASCDEGKACEGGCGKVKKPGEPCCKSGSCSATGGAWPAPSEPNQSWHVTQAGRLAMMGARGGGGGRGGGRGRGGSWNRGRGFGGGIAPYPWDYVDHFCPAGYVVTQSGHCLPARVYSASMGAGYGDVVFYGPGVVPGPPPAAPLGTNPQSPDMPRYFNPGGAAFAAPSAQGPVPGAQYGTEPGRRRRRRRRRDPSLQPGTPQPSTASAPTTTVQMPDGSLQQITIPGGDVTIIPAGQSPYGVPMQTATPVYYSPGYTPYDPYSGYGWGAWGGYGYNPNAYGQTPWGQQYYAMGGAEGPEADKFWVSDQGHCPPRTNPSGRSTQLGWGMKECIRRNNEELK